MKTVLYLIVGFSVCINIAFSQKSKKANPVQSQSQFTEYDYYEKLRLERKEKKIKTISHFYGNNRILSSIERFDTDGKLNSIEVFSGMENPPCKFREIVVTEYNIKGDLSGKEINYDCGVKGNEFEFKEMKPSYFYNIGFGEDLTEEVIYKFDSQNKLIEQIRVCPDCAYSALDSKEEILKNTFDTVSFVYNGNKLIKKIYERGSETLFSYNERDLVEIEQYFDEFGKNSEYDIEFYEYEFYGNKTVSTKQINVSSYEYQIADECIDDYVESNTYEYDGLYTFVHNGNDAYTFYTDNNKLTIEKNFESLTYKDDTYFTNIRFDKNWIYATESGGREFKARFVKLKCDINSQIWKGFIGLLIDEENLYLKQGD